MDFFELSKTIMTGARTHTQSYAGWAIENLGNCILQRDGGMVVVV